MVFTRPAITYTQYATASIVYHFTKCLSKLYNAIDTNPFLLDKWGGMFSPDSIDTTHLHHLKRWRQVQVLFRHFRQRWIQEWLPMLNSRKKKKMV